MPNYRVAARYLKDLQSVSKKSAIWRHKIEELSISFLGVFFPTSPLIPYFYDVTWLTFFRHFVKLHIINFCDCMPEVHILRYYISTLVIEQLRYYRQIITTLFLRMFVTVQDQVHLEDLTIMVMLITMTAISTTTMKTKGIWIQTTMNRKQTAWQFLLCRVDGALHIHWQRGISRSPINQ